MGSSGSFPYAHIACSTSWKQFTVPLRDLDADDTTIVTIFFVEDSPASSRTFFVDQLEVISLAPRVMYTDALASGLSVYNQRSVVNYQATGAWEGRYCLSVKNTGGWGNLPFDFSSTFSTRGYTHLHLAAKSNTNGAVLDVAAFMSWGNEITRTNPSSALLLGKNSTFHYQTLMLSTPQLIRYSSWRTWQQQITCST